MVAGSMEDRKIQLIAVVSPDAAPCFPCGACRQVLHEFDCEEVIVLEPSGEPRRYLFRGLLPHAFGPENL
jgi:cytidine deaminase